ncbi:glycosyl hydrolase family 18 protein [Oceanobacillus sp. Castelsardo]|uniref:glycosyl hydrolase family 18 protein n=1 Tax=Oceanobacillus sp. Castelsardo TaxID=1851204 RepID=UPI00083990F4|nr:glycosyl hydrolase family 18 protein [Oceanobacillus sp. Castelsardo]
MFVYSVKPGDSLYRISQKYHVSVDMLRLVNGLISPNIVPGQALLINKTIYTVQPGDSLYSIAKMAYVPLDRLKESNPGVDPNQLRPGMEVVIPDHPTYTASTFSYNYITGTNHDEAIIHDFAPYSTYYSFFEYHISIDGSLSQIDDLKAIETAWVRHTAPLATITNLTSAGFSPILASQVLNNPTVRQNLINNIYNLVSMKGYAGVNIDFEGIMAQDRDMFSTFLSELKNRLGSEGFLLTVAVPPKTNDNIPWLRGYDYGGIGSVVDIIFIMAYDWHHRGSEPGPVAPINDVRRTIEYALEKMNSRKIILGVPLYGYDWILPYKPGTLARAVSNQSAIQIATTQGTPIQYSESDQSPYFYYIDQLGQSHVVWFEDSRSMASKMELVTEYGLLGIGAWQIGLQFPEGVWLLRKFFNIRRVT